MQTVAAARRYFAVQDEPVPVRDGSGADLPPSSRGLPVSFEAVTFRYNLGEAPSLDGASFEVGAGETVALVGRSGAGKTTAAHLLMRFWDPQAGRITIGGRDIRDFKLDDLRRHIGLVAQDTYLFNTTLWENLKLGNPDATDDEVRVAPSSPAASVNASRSQGRCSRTRRSSSWTRPPRTSTPSTRRR
jgi:ATP-binding cassette subfamily C protein CydCD